MSRIAGKLALVTGASAGIGLACARRFAADGSHLVLWARRADRLRREAEALRRAHGVTVHTATVDVCDRVAVERTVAHLVDGGREMSTRQPSTRSGR